MGNSSFRRKLWTQVGEQKDGGIPNSWFNSLFAFLIVLSIILVVIGTEFSNESLAGEITNKIEQIIGLLFVTRFN